MLLFILGKLILNVSKKKATMTLSVKPFGCMPSAGVSDGVQSIITEKYPEAKIKLEGSDPEGLARVAAVRDAVGDALALRVDFNESLPLADAVPFIGKVPTPSTLAAPI